MTATFNFEETNFDSFPSMFNSAPEADYSELKIDLNSEDNTFSFSTDKSQKSIDYSPCAKKVNSYSCCDSFCEDLDQIPFCGNRPDLNVLAELVRNQIDDKGVEFVVEKCLDIEVEDEPQPLMRKMVRKSPRQIRELRRAFRTTPTWSRQFEEKLAASVGLTRSQVHKWHFDERKRTSQN